MQKYLNQAHELMNAKIQADIQLQSDKSNEIEEAILSYFQGESKEIKQQLEEARKRIKRLQEKLRRNPSRSEIMLELEQLIKERQTLFSSSKILATQIKTEKSQQSSLLLINANHHEANTCS